MAGLSFVGPFTALFSAPNGPLMLTNVYGAGGPYPVWELQTSATDSLRISSIDLNIDPMRTASSATLSGVLAVGFSSSPGIGWSSGSFLNEDGGATGQMPAAKVLTSWSTWPAAPASYLRRVNFLTPAAVSALILGNPAAAFNFKRGLVIPPSTSLSVWFIQATFGLIRTSFQATFICSEGA